MIAIELYKDSRFLGIIGKEMLFAQRTEISYLTLTALLEV